MLGEVTMEKKKRRIKIEDLPLDLKVSRAEMKKISGGLLIVGIATRGQRSFRNFRGRYNIRPGSPIFRARFDGKI